MELNPELLEYYKYIDFTNNLYIILTKLVGTSYKLLNQADKW
ncbi:MAG: hypothetical protein K0Q87_2045 [Neobacillus sp.]|nr:hypothetical protein [Neobacillus sp.]